MRVTNALPYDVPKVTGQGEREHLSFYQCGAMKATDTDIALCFSMGLCISVLNRVFLQHYSSKVSVLAPSSLPLTRNTSTVLPSIFTLSITMQGRISRSGNYPLSPFKTNAVRAGTYNSSHPLCSFSYSGSNRVKCSTVSSVKPCPPK